VFEEPDKENRHMSTKPNIRIGNSLFAAAGLNDGTVIFEVPWMIWGLLDALFGAAFIWLACDPATKYHRSRSSLRQADGGTEANWIARLPALAFGAYMVWHAITKFRGH
jgi:hypothetical protein